MPRKVNKPCLYPGCTKTVQAGYCEAHAHLYNHPQRAIGTRPSSAKRGYNEQWRHIRADVLRLSGIPKDEWHLYNIHHTPNYDPNIDPDHRHYTLTPLLHADHSRITGTRGRKW